MRSSHAELRPLSRGARAWLIHLADPLGRAPRPRRALPWQELAGLLTAAERHGVLPAALRGARALVPDAVAAQAAGATQALAWGREMAAAHAGIGMMLTHHGSRVTEAFRAAGIEGAVVKGPQAARRLYPEAALRTFSDLDILVSTGCRPAAADALRSLGFELFTFADRAGKDYEEDKWLLEGNPKVMIEVHGDLVHSPKLRAGLSVRLADVLEAGDGDAAAPTALLIVAAAHGAIGHQFDRLQHLVDILQAARGVAGAIDVARLRRVAQRSGVLFAVATGIALAGRMFNEPLCVELAERLDAGHTRNWRRLLVTPRVVATAQSRGRAAGSWRRKLYRQCLRLRR